MPLLLAEPRRGFRTHSQHCRFRITDRLQNRGLNARKIDLLASDVRGPLFRGSHGAHHRILSTDDHLQIHHHFRKIDAVGGVRRRPAIQNQLHISSRDGTEAEIPLGIRVDRLMLQSDDVDLHMCNRQLEDVVRRERSTIRTGSHVIERHRLQICPRIDQLAGQRRPLQRRQTDGCEVIVVIATCETVSISIEGSLISRGKNRISLHMHGDGRTAGERTVEEQPGERAIHRGDNGGRNLLPCGIRGIEVIRVQRGRLHSTGEIDLRTVGRSNFIRTIDGSDRVDAETDLLILRDIECPHGLIARRVLRSDLQHMRPGTQIREIQFLRKLSCHFAEVQRHSPLIIELVGQQHDGRTGPRHTPLQ